MTARFEKQLLLHSYIAYWNILYLALIRKTASPGNPSVILWQQSLKKQSSPLTTCYQSKLTSVLWNTVWTIESVPKIFPARCTPEQWCTELWAKRECTKPCEISMHCKVVVHQATGFMVLLCSAPSWNRPWNAFYDLDGTNQTNKQNLECHFEKNSNPIVKLCKVSLRSS